MKKRQSMQQQLNKPQTPSALKEKLYSNWDEQLASSDSLAQEKTLGIFLNVKMMAAAVSFLFVLVVWGVVDKTPSVIYAALNDVSNEVNHDGYSVSIKSIVDEYNINMQPEFISAGLILGMTKYCSLDQKKMLHLQLASLPHFPALTVDSNNVHIFLSKNKISPELWQKNNGLLSIQQGGNMIWEIFQPREGLYVLVLFEDENQGEQIKKVTRKMFYT